MAKVRWAVVVFHEGKRTKKYTTEPKEAARAVKKLRAKGVKSRLVSYNHPVWPPEGDDMAAAGEGDRKSVV